MHLIRQNDAPVTNAESEVRRYYIPDRDPIEIIETIMQPGASQEAHSHKVVREAMLVLEGTVVVEEIVSEKPFAKVVEAGDFVVFDRAIHHRMENKSDKPARTFHFKFLGNGKDRELFLSDKHTLEDVITPTHQIPDIETRYSSYVDTHGSLDKIIWQVPAFLVAISALGFGLLGTFLPKPEAFIPPFTHTETLAVLLFFWGGMYLVGCYVMDRLRFHHSLVEKIIAPLDPQGYFEERLISARGKWPIPATSIVKSVFGALGIALCAWGILLFRL